MTITLTFGTWMVPLAITLLSITCFVVACIFEDRNDLDLWIFVTFVGGIIATAISWVVWLIMTLMTK
jgi:hypothetical protein